MFAITFSARARLRAHFPRLVLLCCVTASPLVAQTGQVGAPPPAPFEQRAALQRGQRPDSALDFRWSELPRLLDVGSGTLNGAKLVVRRADGAPASNLPLRIVLGSSAGASDDARIEGASLVTDTAGEAIMRNVRIGGQPRLVYLAVQTLDGKETSPSIPLAIGAPTADMITLLQAPLAAAVNGATLGAPRVRVLAQGQPASGVVVSVVRDAGSATLTGASATTDREGIASFPELRATSTCTAADCGTVSLKFMVGNASSQRVDVALSLPTVSSLRIDAPAVAQTRSGSLLPALSVHARASDGTAVPGVTITARSADGQLLSTQTTSLSGVALFEDIRLVAPVGPTTISLSTGSVRESIPLSVVAGRPARVTVLDQPPTRVAHDSALSNAPSVKVTDGAGNAVERVRVRAILCVRELPVPSESEGDGSSQAPTAPEHKKPSPCEDLHRFGASLGGTLVKLTTADGHAVFDSLRYRGRSAEGALCFHVEEDSTVYDCSNPFQHNPVRDYDNNLVGISAIKTISGVAPESEFFDLRFRFRLPWRMHVMSHVDLALTSRQDTGKVSSPQKRLTEASLLLNSPALFTKRPDSDVPERLISVGGQLKVFGTVPYWGVHVVAMELGGSPFQGSSLSVGWLRRWSTDTLATVNGDTLHLARHNVGIDFFVRSATVDFFKILTIRGSIVAPFDKKVRLTSRIAIAVPIGSVIRF